MAVKKGATSFADKMRKLFMARDSEGFEKALEEVKDEDGMEKNVPDIHIHMPGAEKVGAEPTVDDEPTPADDPMTKVCAAVDALTQAVTAIGERVAKLESAPTVDEDPASDPASDPDADPATTDADPEDDPEKKGDKKTYDSAALRDEFQDAKARAEILAPGVQLPTYDAKAEGKKTSDAICVLRRRALRSGLTTDNADLVRTIVGDADISKMTCDAAKMAFHASSELVKQKNKNVARKTTDAAKEAEDINKIHADFWSKHKA